MLDGIYLRLEDSEKFMAELEFQLITRLEQFTLC